MKQQKVLLKFPTQKFFNRRGQMMVLYALLIPVILLFVGLALDLGWYYLNVSRMQNAADAAALAGAQKIIDSNSSKLKDLPPVLVTPPDKSSNDDTSKNAEEFPKTTTVTTTKNDNGATITTTVTTTTEADGSITVTTVETTENAQGTTTKTTIQKTTSTKFADIKITDGDETAKDYVVNNLGQTRNIQADEQETINAIIDNWSLFDSPDKGRVVTSFDFFEKNDGLYYEVTLTENIRHFFLPGLFKEGMEAKVVAVAMLNKEPQTEVKTFEQFVAKLEEAKNKNVIVGNWEVQDFYKSMELAYERDDDGNYVIENNKKVAEYAKDINGNYILDSNGNKVQDYTNVYANSTAYTERFKANIYDGAWNHFQDFFNTFKPTGYHDPSTASDDMLIAGDFYRVETVTVRDDVNLASDKPYGANSSVAATSASINLKPGHVYNPKQTSKKKTYKDYPKTPEGLVGDVGYPYKWEYLDSINVDFKPEVTLPDKWKGTDWDVSLPDNSGVSFKYTDWTAPSKSRLITNEYIKRMRIHANINFDEPYKERSDLEYPYKEELRERDAEGNLLPDILWGRIESEPMLFEPDALNGYKTYMKKNQTALSSVRQIIINVNSSNYNTGSVNYRPVIIFYDGPERYSTEDKTRESRPVILNLGKPFRGILYAPNSPVVITGSEYAKNQFKGFVVAKSYVRLKNDNDFVFGGYRYFNSKDKQYEYTRHVENGKVVFRDVDNPSKISGMVTSDAQAYKVAYYYAKDDNSGTKYYRTVENETIIDNGVETPTGNELVLYTDEYGEVQFAEVDGTFKYKIGEYDNFGRTDFTTHAYHVNETSADNMLLSGK